MNNAANYTNIHPYLYCQMSIQQMCICLYTLVRTSVVSELVRATKRLLESDHIERIRPPHGDNRISRHAGTHPHTWTYKPAHMLLITDTKPHLLCRAHTYACPHTYTHSCTHTHTPDHCMRLRSAQTPVVRINTKDSVKGNVIRLEGGTTRKGLTFYRKFPAAK